MFFQVYGYKLVQVDAQSGVPYIVVLTEECESLPSPVTDVQHRTILIAALMHIFMTGAPIKEGSYTLHTKLIFCIPFQPVLKRRSWKKIFKKFIFLMETHNHFNSVRKGYVGFR